MTPAAVDPRRRMALADRRRYVKHPWRLRCPSVMWLVGERGFTNIRIHEYKRSYIRVEMADTKQLYTRSDGCMLMSTGLTFRHLDPWASSSVGGVRSDDAALYRHEPGAYPDIRPGWLTAGWANHRSTSHARPLDGHHVSALGYQGVRRLRV